MLVDKDKIIIKLKHDFPEAEVEMRDLTGLGDHYELLMTDTCFKNQSMLVQHRLINNALQEFFVQGLHAVTIKIKRT